MDDLDRNTAKFYDKIRQSIQHVASSTANSGISSSSIVDGIFGQVTKEEMEKIIDAYEGQQNDKSMSNKSVKCDEDVIKGGSYAKMLHAKPGFHYLGSAGNLIKELEIDDDTRSSFLGGCNTFAVSRSEDLAGLKRKYVIATIEKIVESATEQMNLHHMPQAKELIVQALKLDRKSAPAKVAKGKYHEMEREYEEAAREFREALECENADRKQIGINLSNVLYQLGMKMYHRRDWRQAVILFNQSLEADPLNDGARLHQELCQNNLQREISSRTAFRPSRPSYRK